MTTNKNKDLGCIIKEGTINKKACQERLQRCGQLMESAGMDVLILVNPMRGIELLHDPSLNKGFQGKAPAGVFLIP